MDLDEFLVNYLVGTMLMESIDASSFMKLGEKIFGFSDKHVEHNKERIKH